jgi:hypothetical protein
MLKEIDCKLALRPIWRVCDYMAKAYGKIFYVQEINPSLTKAIIIQIRPICSQPPCSARFNDAAIAAARVPDPSLKEREGKAVKQPVNHPVRGKIIIILFEFVLTISL